MKQAAGIAYTSSAGRMLFLRRAADSDHAGEWCFPGGGVEDGETPEQAAMRESMEEIGALPYGDRRQIHEMDNDDGVHFTTFRQAVQHEFTPRLNDEHTEHVWAGMDDLPEPLHPGVRESLGSMAMDKAMQVRRPGMERLAFDKATVRSIDAYGRMRVEVSPISKAAVNDYLGAEIPKWEELGLDPRGIYSLLRDPEELAKAADSFNGIPLLDTHVPVTAWDHPFGKVVGSTGTDAVFEAPYLKNSLAIWTAEAIERIESDEQRELSSAYGYVADMTPGTYEGIPYHGVMRAIKANHVSLVRQGRAGSDVIVGDSQLEHEDMPKPLSRQATLAKGALMAALKPKLAADAMPNLNGILRGVTAENWNNSKKLIVAKIKPKLAQDADVEALVQLLDNLETEPEVMPAAQDVDDPGNTDDTALDADPVEEILALLRGKVSDEDLKSVEDKLRAKVAGDDADGDGDEEALLMKVQELLSKLKPAKPQGAADTDPPADGGSTPGKEDDVNKTAMDAAIQAATTNAVVMAKDAARKEAREIADAEKFIRPWVGELAIAQDSAESVYKAALETLGVKVEGVHASAYRHILEAQPKPGQEHRVRIAQDSKPAADLHDRFPGLALIKSI